MTFEKLDAGETQVHYQLEYEPAAVGRRRGRGLRACLQARVRDDLRAFKELAESRLRPTQTNDLVTDGRSCRRVSGRANLPS